MTQTLAEASAMSSNEWLELAQEYGAPIIWSGVILVCAFFVSSWVRRLILASCARGQLDPTIARFFAKLTRWGILLIAATFVLNKFGVETASFSVLIGAIGLAVSLAFQGTLSNFASGLMLMIFRPYKLGDSIIAAGQTGTVDEIDLFSTTLDTVDNKRIYIPNSAIFGSVITNVSFHVRRRVDVIVVTVHSAGLDKTQEALLSAASKVTGRLADAPEVVMTDLSGSGVHWQVQVWSTGADYLKVRQSALREIKLALESAGIAFGLVPVVAPSTPPVTAPVQTVSFKQ